MGTRSRVEIVVQQTFWIWWSSMFYFPKNQNEVLSSYSMLPYYLNISFPVLYSQQSVSPCCIYWWSWRKWRWKSTESLLFSIGQSCWKSWSGNYAYYLQTIEAQCWIYGLYGLCVFSLKEICRIKLPSSAMIGEGKPENQNHAIIFSRGEALHTIDMNQVNR